MNAPATILVPFDFSDCAVEALNYGIGLAKTLGARVHVVHVWSPGDHLPMETLLGTVGSKEHQTLSDLARAEARRQLASHIERLGQDASTVSASRVEVGHAGELILTLAEQEHYSLVVLGRSGTGSGLLGSIAERVVSQSPCPVITVGSPATPTPAAVA